MPDQVNPVDREKALLLRTIRMLILLVILLGFGWFIFWMDTKVCPACQGIGKFVVSCGYCDGDGKVSLFKAAAQALPPPPPRPPPEAAPYIRGVKRPAP